MKSLLRNNGLSLVFILLFFIMMIAQAVMGLKVYNEEIREKGGREENFAGYLLTGHFLEATFENWESEFLQMALFVILSTFLFQKGSSESKDPDEKGEPEPKSGNKKKNIPWPVRKGGWILKIYEHSLSLALALLFLFSFLMHWYGSLKDYNEEQILKKLPTENALQYLSGSRFWFESFQNWQSEFLSVFAIIVLSIFLREKNSAQSKPIDAPNKQTGD